MLLFRLNSYECIISNIVVLLCFIVNCTYCDAQESSISPILEPVNSSLIIRDSINTKYVSQPSYFASLTSAYTSNNNWQVETNNLITFASNIQYKHNRQLRAWEATTFLNIDLSYIKYIDSIWYKNIDQSDFSIRWVEKQDLIKNSLCIKLNTQLAPSYEHNEDGNKVIVSNIFNPFTLEMGYGLNWDFGERSNLNLAFATLKLYSIPNYSRQMKTENQFIKINNSVVDMEYGFSSQLYIQKSITETISWENTSNIFFNELNRTQIFLDVSNIFRVELLANLEFTFKSYFDYNPAVSTKRQLSQILMLGIFHKVN